MKQIMETAVSKHQEAWSEQDHPSFPNLSQQLPKAFPPPADDNDMEFSNNAKKPTINLIQSTPVKHTEILILTLDNVAETILTHQQFNHIITGPINTPYTTDLANCVCKTSDPNSAAKYLHYQTVHHRITPVYKATNPTQPPPQQKQSAV